MFAANHENMYLRDNYYRIKNIQRDDRDCIVAVKILPDCNIFNGHFPGNPICPGACSIEIIRECACLLTGWKLTVSSIRQCRFITVARPENCDDLMVYVHATPVPSADCFTIDARISDADNVYVTFRGEMRL